MMIPPNIAESTEEERRDYILRKYPCIAESGYRSILISVHKNRGIHRTSEKEHGNRKQDHRHKARDYRQSCPGQCNTAHIDQKHGQIEQVKHRRIMEIAPETAEKRSSHSAVVAFRQADERAAHG